jgi:hypothetical protein
MKRRLAARRGKGEDRVAELNRRIASLEREKRRAERELRELERPSRPPRRRPSQTADRRPADRSTYSAQAETKPPKFVRAKKDIKDKRGKVIVKKGQTLVRED